MACACGKESCGCSAPPTVYLQDEAGAVHPFLVSDRLEVEHQEYALLVSCEDADQIALLKVFRSPDGQEHYQNIESEAEWTRLQALLFQPH